MSRRIGQLTHVERYIDPMPSPASYVPKIQAEVRVFYPPNADIGDVMMLIEDAAINARLKAYDEWMERE